MSPARFSRLGTGLTQEPIEIAAPSVSVGPLSRPPEPIDPAGSWTARGWTAVMNLVAPKVSSVVNLAGAALGWFGSDDAPTAGLLEPLRVLQELKQPHPVAAPLSLRERQSRLNEPPIVIESPAGNLLLPGPKSRAKESLLLSLLPSKQIEVTAATRPSPIDAPGTLKLMPSTAARTGVPALVKAAGEWAGRSFEAWGIPGAVEAVHKILEPTAGAQPAPAVATF